MTCRLAPERPQPWSVISECYFQDGTLRDRLPRVTDHGKSSFFGEEYEREFTLHLAKHAEVNCDDRVCLIGEEPQWASIIQERLFLIQPVDFIDCRNITKELFSTCQFDRIIFLNCLHQVNKMSVSFTRRLYKALTSHGRLIVIHREASLNALVLPSAVLRKWQSTQVKDKRFLEQIHRQKRDNDALYQQVETIKFVIHKLNWFSLISNQVFYPLTLIDQKQIIDGLRRLNETFFKYHRDLVEMNDRLLFLTIQNDVHLPSSRSKSNQ